MDKTVLYIEVLFTSSKTLELLSKEITFDKYKIISIPTIRESLNDSYENHLLTFFDVWRDSQRSSNPEKEADYILSILSLMLQMKIEFNSIKINNLQGTIRRKRSSFLNGKITLPPDLDDLFKKLCSLDADVLRQYLRSCDAYMTALSLIDNNPTLSFFLLVTAIEAISNKVMGSDKISDNFRQFILKYVPNSFENELGDRRLLELLIEQAYKMRSAFTHGGTEISIGTLSADSLNRNYVKHYVEGKEVCSPSLRWFENLVRAVLLEFLRAQKIVEGAESKLSDLAMKEGVMDVKLTRVTEVGRIVTPDDVDLDFRNESKDQSKF
jgi:hypothetical protein